VASSRRLEREGVMRIGIDSYSYHRRYGEVRPGEQPPPDAPWPLEPSPVLAHARSLAVDDLMLETCYLPPPPAIDASMLATDGTPRIGFSWGHPWPQGAFHGLDGGRSRAAEADLVAWIELAARLVHSVMRITLGSPASRGDEPAAVLIDRLIEPVRRVAAEAEKRGLVLAIENHGDLTASELIEIVERVECGNVGVTLDNVNLIRLGDDMIEGTRLLAPWTHIVQLKDHLPTADPGMVGGPVCTALGAGVAPLDQLLDVLGRAGFEGPVCVELASLGMGPVDELEMIARSVDWLRQHVPGQ
jgi:sugar phosphate isomerase/epimerase